jgi:thiamine-phosphate pyrophosphorylase
MHNYKKIYYFIDDFNIDEIGRLNKNISLIYRNYKKEYKIDLIKKIRDICVVKKHEFFISNNLKIAKELSLNGIYIPSFDTLENFNNLSVHKNFKIIGSAHNKAQIINKKKQGCSEIFVSPIFKNKNYSSYLGVNRFNLITNALNVKVIALGGIDLSNFSKLNLTNCDGFASIRWIKKTGLK